MELVANFSLNNESLEAQFDINETTNFDALFEINVVPDISGLATKEELQEVSDTINTRIDGVVEAFNNDIEDINSRMIDTVIGDDLIGVTRQDNTVTLNSQTFVFEQGIPATEWVINHNLNKRPSIELVYSNGQRFEAYKEYINNNQVVVMLDAAATGYAYLN